MGQPNSTQSFAVVPRRGPGPKVPKFPRIYMFLGDHACGHDQCTVCILTTYETRCSLCGMLAYRAVCNEKCRHVYCFDCMEDFLQYASRPRGAWTLETRLTCRCPEPECRVLFDRLIHCWYGLAPGQLPVLETAEMQLQRRAIRGAGFAVPAARSPPLPAIAGPKISRIERFIVHHECGREKCTACVPAAAGQRCSLCGRRVLQAVCSGKCRHVYCFECMEDFLQYASRPRGAWTLEMRLTCRCPEPECAAQFDRLMECWPGVEPDDEQPAPAELVGKTKCCDMM